MTKDEALRLALEALRFALHVGFDESSETQIKKGDKAWRQHQQAINAIKQALETKDEPVPWEQFHEHMAGPNYVAPQRTWVGLTDEEIQECLQGLPTQTIHVYARRIEDKLKEKNYV